MSATTAGFSNRRSSKSQSSISRTCSDGVRGDNAADDDADDDDDDDDFADVLDEDGTSLGISKLSIDGRLPSGTAFVNLQKIRSTINSYTAKLAENTWYYGFKYPTVLAIQRRLKPYKDDCHRHCMTEVARGYKDLCRRLAALLKLWKCMKRWADTQRYAALVEVLPPLKVLEMAKDAIGFALSPRMEVLKQHALFAQALYADDKDIVQCLDVVSVSSLVESCSTFAAADVKEEVATGEKALPVDVTVAAPVACKEEVHDGAEPQKKPRQKAKTHNATAMPFDIDDSASHHCGIMVSEGLKK